jgi:hypothetical protein
LEKMGTENAIGNFRIFPRRYSISAFLTGISE